MIQEVLCGALSCTTVLNAIVALLLYRQYLTLAVSSMEFAALITSSIEEKEDGTLSVDPLTLAATTMDHMSQLSGILKWIRL
jgi:hypothetical protein